MPHDDRTMAAAVDFIKLTGIMLMLAVVGLVFLATLPG